MPTENPRVAAYIPQPLKAKFDAFKSERGIKSDSQALIAILSERFGVGHLSGSSSSFVDYSEFVTKEEFLALVEKVAALSNAIEARDSPSSLFSKLPEKLKTIEGRIDSLEVTTGELEVAVSASGDSETHPGQMNLLDATEPAREIEESPGSPPFNSSLQPLNGPSLSRRFGLNEKVVTNQRNTLKNDPDKFTAWTKKKDPDGIPWRYDAKNKLYYPIINSSQVSISSSPI